MSNSQEPKKQYELPSDLIEEFLSVHGFVVKEIAYFYGHTKFVNEGTKQYVKVPTKKLLTKMQIEKCLIDAGLSFADLDAYIEHLKAVKLFDSIMEESLNRSSKRIKKRSLGSVFNFTFSTIPLQILSPRNYQLGSSSILSFVALQR